MICLFMITLPLVHASFIAFGDWGINSTDYQASVVALSNYHPDFTVLLGDNFYPSGVSSVEDTKWRLFTTFQNTAPVFYGVLGNHDYGGSIDAQSEYAIVNPFWKMPARYFYRILPFRNTLLCGIFLDSFDLDETQVRWLNVVLASQPCQQDSTYRFVFTHYPINTVGGFVDDSRVRDLQRNVKPLLQQYRVHAFVCGHEHDFQVFEDGGVWYIISGVFSDKYDADITDGQSNKLLFRDYRTPGFAVFRAANDTSINVDLVDSRNLQSVYTTSIDLNGNWSLIVDPSHTDAIVWRYSPVTVLCMSWVLQ